MRHWHQQFLGRTQLPPTLSALTISEFFTLDGAEIRTVLSRCGMEMRLEWSARFWSYRLKPCAENNGMIMNPFQRAHFKAEGPWAHLAHPFLLRSA
jgi:hypothetical protein